MGCWLSTDTSSQEQKSRSAENRAPPPCADEETVKEVLSVTPAPEPKTKLLPIDFKDDECTRKCIHPVKDKVQRVNTFEKKKLHEEEMSEVSEICSLSLSESLSTAITDKRGDEDEVRQRMARSPAKFAQRNGFSGDVGPKRERVVGRSPTRRSEQSPARKNGVNGGSLVRVVHGREAGQVSRLDMSRRDPGDRSGRRTGISGAANRSTMGRSPSAKRINQSPDRVRMDHRVKKMEENSKKNNSSSASESLENPLVSLECFIFL